MRVGKSVVLIRHYAESILGIMSQQFDILYDTNYIMLGLSFATFLSVIKDIEVKCV